MEDLLSQLGKDKLIGDLVCHSRLVPARPARYASPRTPLPAVLAGALDSLGIHRLYSHQVDALDHLAAGRNVLAVTPTASGKSLIFALPVLQSILEDRSVRALFLYPTKALARDQIAGLRRLALAASPLRPPTFEIYDGDTTQHQRKKIRADPPNVLITNPDMLHFSILANHHAWEPFLGNLLWVVLDELHVYRGMFGAHVHHVLRRLKRLAGHRRTLRFVAASATIGNPEEFARILTGEPFAAVTESGAAGSEKHVLFLNPVMVSPYTVAVRVVAAAARAGLRTIAFTKARRITELLHTWLVRQEPGLAGQVAPYRAGYLPEERRRIEERLFRGDLKAVLTTSALELGIDVGSLDICVLVGYPGSLMSSWQRIGRVGRTGRPALVVMIAMPDTLDQYVISHPDRFFGDSFERAVLDPSNEVVAGSHLICAAAEKPLCRTELREDDGGLERLAEKLVEGGDLAEDAAGERFCSFRLKPHRHMNLRGAGRPFTIVEAGNGQVLGTIDGGRVYQECHPEAIYLHGGRTLRIRELDEDKRTVAAEPFNADYFTVVLGEKETEILEVRQTRQRDHHRAGYGRLKVTIRIHGYQKKQLFGGGTISEHALEAPEQVYETTGFWIEMPSGWAAEFASRELNFMGGIHAVEHALIGLFPVLAISDRADIGGISHTGHPQLTGPGIFIYDGVPGGAGLAERGFRDLESLLRQTLDHVAACSCEDGCPGCIHSPKCGNGNRPLDKVACVRVLEGILGQGELSKLDLAAERPQQPEPPAHEATPRKRHGIIRAPDKARAPEGKILVLDLETRRSAEDVGGWGNAHRMGLALAVVYDVGKQEYRTYFEEEVDRLLLDLLTADQVVGFNLDRFDLMVLSGYTDGDLGRVRTCDLLALVHERLGYRLSLQHLSEVNLGESKSGTGLQSLKWWKEGKIDLIESYCRKDVEMTRRLWEIGRNRGYLLYRDKRDRTLRIRADW